MFDVKQTIVSQFTNSPTLSALVANMDSYINPAANIQAFYDKVWNIDTASGFGLDIWGRIVDVSRYLKIPYSEKYFGFSSPAGASGVPFGQGVFAPPIQNQTTTYQLTDDAYRRLILCKCLSNIVEVNAPAVNQLLQKLFPGRGRCYVNNLGGMNVRYVFEFNLLPYEQSIVTSSGVLPIPAGCGVSFLIIDPATTFGFSSPTGASGVPFGQGVFYN